jgi:hypothetical protein
MAGFSKSEPMVRKVRNLSDVHLAKRAVLPPYVLLGQAFQVGGHFIVAAGRKQKVHPQEFAVGVDLIEQLFGVPKGQPAAAVEVQERDGQGPGGQAAHRQAFRVAPEVDQALLEKPEGPLLRVPVLFAKPAKVLVSYVGKPDKVW